MMLGRWWWLVVALAAPGTVLAQEPGARPPTVRAILFYSPTCPHCADVINEGLPSILARYGEQLQVAGVNTATPGGEQLYRAAIESLAIPPERVGVPTLIVGSTVLVGSLEIPGRLPGLVDAALADTGIDWPDVPLIRQALAAQGMNTARGDPVPEPAAAPDATPDAGAGGEPGPGTGAAAGPELAGAIDPDARAALVHELSVVDRLMLDPAGNGAAIAVLVLMLAALAVVGADVVAGRIRVPAAPAWVIPVLGAVGMAVAAYLSFVEVTGAEAVCGPVGDCNTVQQSAYARILGVPVGLLGVVGYAVILATWLAGRLAGGPVPRLAGRAVWWLALVATAFSAYLTVLEPFVIGASCAWCLSSALVATLLLLAATPGRRGREAEWGVGVSPTRRPSVSH